MEVPPPPPGGGGGVIYTITGSVCLFVLSFPLFVVFILCNMSEVTTDINMYLHENGKAKSETLERNDNSLEVTFYRYIVRIIQAS